MDNLNIYEAKTRLWQLVDLAAAGDDVVVSRHGKPLVRITRLVGHHGRQIKFGVLKGKCHLAADSDAALPADVLASFTGQAPTG